MIFEDEFPARHSILLGDIKRNIDQGIEFDAGWVYNRDLEIIGSRAALSELEFNKTTCVKICALARCARIIVRANRLVNARSLTVPISKVSADHGKCEFQLEHPLEVGDHFDLILTCDGVATVTRLVFLSLEDHSHASNHEAE